MQDLALIGAGIPCAILNSPCAYGNGVSIELGPSVLYHFIMTQDMTRGNVYSHIIKFAVPIVLGNILQLTYNAVDSIIVSRAAGTAAMAAVGTATPVMNIIILGISGLTIGASVIISRAFGAHDEKSLRTAFASMLTLGIIFSFIICAVALTGTRSLLRLMRVPPELLDPATSYLRIILLGTVFTYLYNAYTAAMRAVGDSRTPVIYLGISTCVNVALDCLFIIAFRMEVAGAAFATIISEALSALLCFLYNQRKKTLLAIRFSEFHPDKSTIFATLSYGATTALQQSCQPIGKLLIQGIINTLGIGPIAVFNAVTKIESFALIPEQSISHAMMTFTGQNRGARNKERIGRGLRAGLLTEAAYAIIILVMILLLKAPLMRLFLSEASLIDLGADYLALMAVFYIESAFTNGIQGYFRGMGRMRLTLAATLIQIVGRVIFSFIFVPRLGLIGVAWATAIGWAAMLVVIIPIAAVIQKKPLS